MLISIEWLNDHMDLGGLSPEEVGELMTTHTAEVDGVRDPCAAWAGIAVGHVQAVRPHPDADKLRLVTVETGHGEVEVVCGAPNVAEGQRICYAPEGTTLPGGLKLKKRKIRGVESRGMVLSERELGLGEDHDGILVLDATAPVGTPLADVLGSGAVIDVDNKALTVRPDLWGHYGMARDIAAVLGKDLRPLELAETTDEPAQVRVTVETPELCPRYLGWVIGGVKVEPSPDWLRRRLEQVGQRRINNIVDLTNYILLECGQPLHAFDRRQIADGHIIVRKAAAGESITTLDGVERELPEGACVIADPERAVAIAGVMGMANSEVMDDTTEIILEIANFERTSIRSTSKTLGLRTESAVRFEKGLDPRGVPVAARRFLKLLKEICPTAKPLGGPCDVCAELPETKTISYREGWIARRLGTPLAEAEEDGILQRLGFGVKRAGGSLKVTVPSWRADGDVGIPEDLVEEVGRIHGYDRIEPVALRGDLEPIPVEPAREARGEMREALSAKSGLTEFHMYPFTTAEQCGRARIDAGSLQVANAEQPGLDLMTPSLIPGLLRTVGENRKRRDEVALYVIAPVFRRGAEGELPNQDERCAIAVSLREGQPVFEMKGALETVLTCLRIAGVRFQQQTDDAPPWLHPGRCARLARGKETFGWMGQVHPAVARGFDIDPRTAVADLDMKRIGASRGILPNVKPISRYPTVPFDVAVVVPERTQAGEVSGVLEHVDGKLVRSVRLFDVYTGKNIPGGTRSLAFAITFGSYERTLGTADVERLRADVSSAIKKRGWSLRV